MVGNIVQIIIAAKDLTAAAFTKVQTKIGVLKGVATKLGTVFKAVSKAAVLIGGAAVLAAVGGGIKAFIDFEDAMANVRKTTGLSKEDITDLGDAIKIMAEDIPVGHIELAKIATIAGQLGIEGKENILSFTESVAQISVAFDMTAEDVAIAMAKLGTIYKIPIEETDNLASAINVLGNTTAAKEKEILSFAMSLGPTAEMLGFGATEAFAMGAAMISIGVDANDAGTRLSRAFTMIGKNIGELSGFLGIAEEDFRQLFEERPMDALMLVITKLSEVEGKLKANTVASELFNEVGAKAIKALAANAGDLKTNLENAKRGYREGIAVQEEYAAKIDTLKGKFQLLKNSITNILIDIGTALAPGITELIETFRGALPKIKEIFFEMGEGAREFAESIVDQTKPAFEELAEKAKEAGTKMSAGLDFSTLADDIGTFIGAALSPLITAFGWLIEKLGPLFDLIGTGVGKFHEFANALKTEEGKIDDVRDAIKELTDAKQDLITANETLSEKTVTLADALEDANGWTETLTGLEVIAKTKTEDLATARADAAKAIAEYGPELDIAKIAIENVKTAEEEAKTATENYQTELGKAAGILADTGVASDTLKDKYYDFVDANEAVVTAEGEVIDKTAELKTEMEEAQQAPLDLKAKFTEFGDSVKVSMSEIPLCIAEQFAKIPNIIGDIFTTVGKKIAKFGESLPDFIGSGIVDIGNKFSEMGTAFDTVSEDIITKTETLRDSFKTNIEDPLSEDIPEASEEMQGAFSNAATAMGTDADTIKTDIDAVGTTFEELPAPIGEVADATGYLQEAIKDDMDKVSIDVDGTKVTFEGLKGKVDDVVGEFENFEDIAGKLIGLDWSVFTTLEAELPGIDRGIGDMKTAFEGLKTVLDDNIDNLESIQTDLGNIESTITPFVNNIAPGVTAIGNFATALSDTQSALSTFASMSTVDIKGMIGFSTAIHSMVTGLKILDGQIGNLMPSFGDMTSLIRNITNTFVYSGGRSDILSDKLKEMNIVFQEATNDTGNARRALQDYLQALAYTGESHLANVAAGELARAYMARFADETEDTTEIINDFLNENIVLETGLNSTTNSLKHQTGQLNKISGAIEPLIAFLQTLGTLMDLTLGEDAIIPDLVMLQEAFASLETTMLNLGTTLQTVDMSTPITQAITDSEDFRTSMEENGAELAILMTYIETLMGYYVDLAQTMADLSKLQEELGKGGLDVGTAFGNIRDYIEGLTAFIPDLATALIALKTVWDENSDAIHDGIDAFNEVMGAITNVKVYMDKWIQAELDIETATDNATEAVGEESVELENLKTPLEEAAGTTTDLKTATEGANEAIGIVTETVAGEEGALTTVKTAIEETTGFTNDLKTATEGANEAIGTVTETVAGEADELAGHSLTTALEESATSTGIFEQATSHLRDVIGSLISAISEAASAITGNFRNAILSVESIMTSVSASAYGWGHSLMYNFVEGIYSEAAALQTAMASMASIVNAYIGVASNTKLGALSHLEDFGPNLVHTFSEGIREGLPNLNKTLTGLSLGDVSLNAGMAGSGSSTKTVYMTVHQNIGNRSDADYAVREIERLMKKPQIV